MSVHVISKFAPQVALRPSSEETVFSTRPADAAADRHTYARPATVAIDSLGCMRGIAVALAFEAGVVLAGAGIWELWRLIK